MTTSEQARKDAMADAETLLRYLSEWGLWAIDVARATTEAEAAGVRAAAYLRSGHFDGGEIYSFDAARAAFRAVPGLRGDK